MCRKALFYKDLRIVKTCKKCRTCGKIKERSEFYRVKNINNTDSVYVSSVCKPCVSLRNKSARAKERRAELRGLGGPRNRELKREYGITLEDYGAVLEQQGFGCCVCGRKDSGHSKHKNFSVDHDHKTGIVRGLLCSPCNHAIGLLGDDPQRIRAAANYLETQLPQMT